MRAVDCERVFAVAEQAARDSGRYREFCIGYERLVARYYSPSSIWELLIQRFLPPEIGGSGLRCFRSVADQIAWHQIVFGAMVLATAVPVLFSFLRETMRPQLLFLEPGAPAGAALTLESHEYPRSARAAVEYFVVGALYALILGYVAVERKEKRRIALACFLRRYYLPYGESVLGEWYYFGKAFGWAVLLLVYVPSMALLDRFCVESGGARYCKRFSDDWVQIVIQSSAFWVAASKIALLQSQTYGFVPADVFLHPEWGRPLRALDAVREGVVTAAECDAFEARQRLEYACRFAGVPTPDGRWAVLGAGE